MRTLKKTLCLVLALAMVMSLGVSAFAASAKDDYTDYASVAAKHKEAVDVMTAAGVFNGMGDSANSFAPTGTLTREQAAKIVTYMLMEKANADTLTAIVAPYSDVPATRWSAGAIAYCTNEGILAGVGGGKFDPEGTLTGLQFAKMLVCALGYDAKEEGLEGDSWAVNTAKLLIYAGLNGSLETVALTGGITREQAAQMAFNAFKANTVEYDNRVSANVGGVEISISGKANPVETTQDYGKNYKEENGEKYIVQFVEQYQRKLRYNGNDPDVFGRPGHGWTFDGVAVGTYTDTAAITFSKETNVDGVRTALSGYEFKNAGNDNTYKPGTTATATTTAVLSATDRTGECTSGEISFDNETPAAYVQPLTGNGRSVEIFASNRQITNIVVIEYNVSKITNIVTNGSGDVTYTMTGAMPSPVNNADPDKPDTVSLHGTVAKDAIVTFAKDKDDVYHIYPTTTVVGTQSAHNAGKKTITVDDTVYTVGNAVWSYLTEAAGYIDITTAYDDPQFPNSTKEANFYFDQFGIAVYSEAISETQYAAIDAIAMSGHLSDDIEAILVFPDATTKKVEVSKIINEDATPAEIDDVYGGTNSEKLIGVICTYIVDDDGKYELTAVPTAGGKSETVDPGLSGVENVTVKGEPKVKVPAPTDEIVTDANTVFVVKSTESGKAVFRAYTGYAGIPTITGGDVRIDYAKNRNSENVDFVYIDATGAGSVTAEAEAGDFVVLKNLNYTTSGTGSSTIYYYEAIINGEDGTLATRAENAVDASGGEIDLAAKTLYKVTQANDAGVATRLTLQLNGDGKAGDDYKALEATNGDLDGSKSAHGTVIEIGDESYTFDPDTVKVYIIDKDGKLIGDDISQLDFNNTLEEYDRVYIKFKATGADTMRKLEAVYAIKNV